MLYILLLFLSLTAFADELPRPVWVQSDVNPYINQIIYQPNDFNTEILGGSKKVAELQQKYYDQVRFHDLYCNYTINAYDNQPYLNQMSTTSNPLYGDMYTQIRSSEAKPFIQGLQDGVKRGDIPPSVQYTGAVVGGLTGNNVSTNIGQIKITTRIDVMSSRGYISTEYPFGKSEVTVNPQASEFYVVNVNQKLIYGANANFNYGGTTQVTRISMGCPIWKHIGADISNVWGNTNYGINSEFIYRFSYGVTF